MKMSDTASAYEPSLASRKTSMGQLPKYAVPLSTSRPVSLHSPSRVGSIYELTLVPSGSPSPASLEPPSTLGPHLKQRMSRSPLSSQVSAPNTPTIVGFRDGDEGALSLQTNERALTPPSTANPYAMGGLSSPSSDRSGFAGTFYDQGQRPFPYFFGVLSNVRD